MNTYTIKLEDDLSAIYEDIAKLNGSSVEEALQTVLQNVIETLIKRRPPNGEYPRKWANQGDGWE